MRVVLADMPGMLGDIVGHAVTDQPDMELVGHIVTSAEAPALIGDQRADVIVVGRELSELAATDLDLLCGCRTSTVLVVTKDGRHAYRYELRSERIPLGADTDGVSPTQLVAAIRKAASRTGSGAELNDG